MARHECCCEIEMAIFATRTNLPVSDFQTWQVCCTPLFMHIMRTLWLLYEMLMCAGNKLNLIELNM